MTDPRDIKRIILVFLCAWLIWTVILPIHQTGYNLLTLNTLGDSDLMAFIFFLVFIFSIVGYLFYLSVNEFKNNFLAGIGLISFIFITSSGVAAASHTIALIPITLEEFTGSVFFIFIKWISLILVMVIISNISVTLPKKMGNVPNKRNLRIIYSILLGLFMFQLSTLIVENQYVAGPISPSAFVLFEWILIVCITPCWYSVLVYYQYEYSNRILNALLLMCLGPIAVAYGFSKWNSLLGSNLIYLFSVFIIFLAAFICINLAPGSYFSKRNRRKKARLKREKLEEDERTLHAPKYYEDFIKKADLLSQSVVEAKERGDYEKAKEDIQETVNALKKARDLLPHINPETISSIEDRIAEEIRNLSVIKVQEIVDDGERLFREGESKAAKEIYSDAITSLNNATKVLNRAVKLAEDLGLEDFAKMIEERIPGIFNRVSIYQRRVAESFRKDVAIQPELRRLEEIAVINPHLWPKVFDVPIGEPDPMLVAVMMPFKEEFNPVYEAIKTACKKCKLICIRADEIFKNEEIKQKIFALIYQASVVICDFTEKNSNVLYEAGIAHTCGRDTILITQVLDDCPFDIHSYTIIKYKSAPEGLVQLQQSLIKLLKSRDQKEGS